MNFYPLSSPNPHTFTTFIYRERTRFFPQKSLMFQKLLFKVMKMTEMAVGAIAVIPIS
ncbi:hypothetical protein Hanom_Chr04g00346561 [Helianthus anomalus]